MNLYQVKIVPARLRRIKKVILRRFMKIETAKAWMPVPVPRNIFFDCCNKTVTEVDLTQVVGNYRIIFADHDEVIVPRAKRCMNRKLHAKRILEFLGESEFNRQCRRVCCNCLADIEYDDAYTLKPCNHFICSRCYKIKKQKWCRICQNYF